MSSLSQAGKGTYTSNLAALSNQVNRAFTKGLIGVDPNQLEKKQMQRKMYQQELRLQAEEHRKRKQAEKERERLEDQKLQRKIQADIQREKQQATKANNKDKNPFGSSNSNNNPPVSNNKQNSTITQPQTKTDLSPPGQRKNLFNPSHDNTTIPSKGTFSSPEISLYKHSNQEYQGYGSPGQNSYGYAPRSVYSVQEEKYYQQEMQNRARRFKQTLDKKLEEVYRQIQTSKKSYGGENVVDEIRRRLKSNNYMNSGGNEYFDGQKSNVKQFEDEFSMFYKIPKRSNDTSAKNNQTVIKNLDYDSESRYKSSLRNNNYRQEDNLAQENSRMHTDRPERSEYGDVGKKWGNKRKENFLGNRQALDYKIESSLSNIDNIMREHNMHGDNY